MRLGGTSFRTFVVYPVLIVAWELWLNDGRVRLQPWFLPLAAWGYMQYRLAERFGAAYLQYRSAVKRWIPALF